MSTVILPDARRFSYRHPAPAMELDLPAILARIEQRLADLSLSADEASKRAGKPDAIRNIRRAVRKGQPGGVTLTTVAALAKTLSVRVSWLVEGKDIERVPLDAESEAPPSFVDDAETLAAAERFERRQLQPGEVVERDVVAGLGYGGQAPVVTVDGKVVDEVRAVWRLPVDYLRTELRAREADVDFIPVEGDSMSPTLLPGDRVLVNRSLRQPSDGLFVIHDGVGPAIKRLEIVTGSSPLVIRILSDNKMHTPKTIAAEDLVVIGRVICRVTRL